MNTFLISDTHFGHVNILKYDNRPFENIKEHDETLIKNWNEVVSKTDDIYFLGDFSFMKDEVAELIMKQLNGNKLFIKGNHDKCGAIKLYEKYGTYLGELFTTKINKQPITLCHYKMEVWDRSHYGSWHLFGHSHGKTKDNPNSLCFDVGVNCNYYHPIEFEQVSNRMKVKHFVNES